MKVKKIYVCQLCDSTLEYEETVSFNTRKVLTDAYFDETLRVHNCEVQTFSNFPNRLGVLQLVGVVHE